MRPFRDPKQLLLLAAVAGVTPAMAQYTSGFRDILTPNTGQWPLTGRQLGDTTLINLGLQGVGRFPASSTDPVTGESVGSFSDMQITSWTRNGDGSYSGVLDVLPDRGYNSGATFSNFGARINEFSFTFTPFTAPVSPGVQNQIALNFSGSTLFTYDHDNNVGTPAIPTTGVLPDVGAPGVGTFLGKNIPVVSANTTLGGTTVANRLTLDAEGLAFDNRAGKQGSGWFGDEYGGNLYHFNASKQIDGVLGIPTALVPHEPAGGTIDYQTDAGLDNGRRVNQGFEGVSITPDGTKLFALLQSATIQDSGAGNQGRANAVRLLSYDITGTDSPTDPSHQYVIQLPRIDDNGGTPAVNRAGAQSSILALNDHQLLILSRDGNGRGASGSPVFKSILLADLTGATDIDGSYDAEGNFVTTAAGNGILSPTITPISWTEALNLLGKLDLSVTELEQFGLNLNTAPGDINTLSEKWEALALVPADDPLAPNDYFLFVANDNDFLTANTKMYDTAGVLQTYAGALENDSVVLAFRIQLVPEPSTYAAGVMLAVTVGGLWWNRRGRQA